MVIIKVPDGSRVGLVDGFGVGISVGCFDGTNVGDTKSSNNKE